MPGSRAFRTRKVVRKKRVVRCDRTRLNSGRPRPSAQRASSRRATTSWRQLDQHADARQPSVSNAKSCPEKAGCPVRPDKAEFRTTSTECTAREQPKGDNIVATTGSTRRCPAAERFEREKLSGKSGLSGATGQG